ncbi:hypothetical protein OBBRIDRAFT_824865 [Obba rivulosa]|uniref:phosphoinositide 5-phosphatase n=1 Tax=Obba rivulosa TaxID=1052685 RepID=A0A8E2B596_9APHY|nr:hypothetical protein OBBRIDRAFT_824865 [Obba rivulosa]
MTLLHALSFAGAAAAFIFIILSLASGLLWLSELIEEHSRLAKVLGQRGIYVIILIHTLLYFYDSLPLKHVLFSIFCHVVYLQNFTTSWPSISLTSLNFISSCILVILDHFLWFFYFARVTQEARHRARRPYGNQPTTPVPGFGDIATFFGVCVWLVPLFLFLSLSANDNALPLDASRASVPSTPVSQSTVMTRSRASLFKSLFDSLPLDALPRIRPRPRRRDTSEGIIAPRSPSVKRATSPMPSPAMTPIGLPRVASSGSLPPPLTPSLRRFSSESNPGTLGAVQEIADSPDQLASIQLSAPPRRSSGPSARRSSTDGRGRLEMRRVASAHVSSIETYVVLHRRPALVAQSKLLYDKDGWNIIKYFDLIGGHGIVMQKYSRSPQLATVVGRQLSVSARLGMHLYLRDSPRTLYLVTSSQDELQGYPSRVLVFRAAESNPSQAVVEFLPKAEVDLTNAVRLTSRPVKGCLGLISISNDMFLAVITSATEVGNTRGSAPIPEVVAQIHDVGFYCLTSPLWDSLLTAGDPLASPGFGDQPDALLREPSYYQNSSPAPTYEHPCAPLSKIISGGTFYYASEPQWDLTSRLSVRLSRARAEQGRRNIAVYDERFLWNEFLVRSLLDFRERLDPHEREELDRCQFIILAIQGFVGVHTFALPAPPTSGAPTVATLALISRLGWKRSGTRFNTRGVDDDGNCANFVETETLFSTEQNCFSYVQVRGSVPLFWEQQGLQTFGQRIQITRPQASQPAFDRHFMHLIEEYGSVHAINLLGSKENEATLTNAYARHMQLTRNALGDVIGITHFDFHNAVKIGGHESVVREIRRLPTVGENVDKFGFTMADSSMDEIITEQKGVFRTNCLDCLDRTNFVQDILSRTTLEQYLVLIRREWLHSASMWSFHRELWAENGDALSRIYAGTGALNTSYTRSGKRTLAGVLSDATKSVSRAYINNFQDKGKQIAIDMFVGNLSTQKQVTIFDPIHDSVRVELERRLSEYSTTKHCILFVGTWNLNGKPPSSESLLPWLFPRTNTPDPDMFVIGFQEIVPLTAQQIVQADLEKRRMWETKILETLNKKSDQAGDYVLLRSQQLVGTALLVFVKAELTAVIRNVEAATHKTGLRGMSGNKGAVGIRLDYHDTNFCFITAHLAAGHSNVDERNADYHTIVDGLHFLKGKTIDSHDNVIWLADTNYRIDLENERVRYLALSDDFDGLVAADQLKQCMDEGEVFVGYQEGPLLFRPTYKYDLGTDDYDTGEKMRIPAWTGICAVPYRMNVIANSNITDRVLIKGRQLELQVYSRAELKSSDHRPVFAIFRAEVWIIDHAKRAALSRLLLESVTSTAPGERLDEKLASMTFPSEVPDLPPPSSDDASWWHSTEHPNGVFVPQDGTNVPSRRPTNPFDSPSDSSLSSSPSPSEETEYNQVRNQVGAFDALTLQNSTTSSRRPAPPPPTRPRKPSVADSV